MDEIIETLRITGYHGEDKWYKWGDYTYVASRQRGTRTTLRCPERHCAAVWHHRRADPLPPPLPIAEAHNHPPVLWTEERNRMFQILKRRAADEAGSLHEIYVAVAAEHPNAAPHLLYEEVCSTMRRCRRRVLPNVPRTLAAYSAALAVHDNFSAYHLGEVEAGGARAVILAMPTFGPAMREASTILVDATFLTVPAGPPAAQILTIHIVIEGHYFHPVVALMANRTRALYIQLLRRVWQVAGQPAPATVIADYEEALTGALNEVTGVPTQGCFFHYSQALLRRARAEGMPVQRAQAPALQLVRLYISLALLPPERVQEGANEIRGIAEANNFPFNNRFHDYYMAYWMGRVGPQRFSVHSSPHRTNNIAESFHAQLRRMLGANPNIWNFTSKMFTYY